MASVNVIASVVAEMEARLCLSLHALDLISLTSIMRVSISRSERL
jgi:hypothetical protein